MLKVAFAGLVYLALWLCAKLGVMFPVFSTRNTFILEAHNEHELAGSRRTEAAAAPIYLAIFPIIPIGAAIYISSTRYSDYWHHGFDVFVSAILGTATAWLGFRWYHMPIRSGAGWAWAPRTSKKAFWKSIGTPTYTSGSGRNLENLESGDAGGNQYSYPSASRRVRNSDNDGRDESYEMNTVRMAVEPTDFTADRRVRP